MWTLGIKTDRLDASSPDALIASTVYGGYRDPEVSLGEKLDSIVGNLAGLAVKDTLVLLADGRTARVEVVHARITKLENAAKLLSELKTVTLGVLRAMDQRNRLERNTAVNIVMGTTIDFRTVASTVITGRKPSGEPISRARLAKDYVQAVIPALADGAKRALHAFRHGG
jgi:hypothetical protein